MHGYFGILLEDFEDRNNQHLLAFVGPEGRAVRWNLK